MVEAISPNQITPFSVGDAPSSARATASKRYIQATGPLLVPLTVLI